MFLTNAEQQPVKRPFIQDNPGEPLLQKHLRSLWLLYLIDY